MNALLILFKGINTSALSLPSVVSVRKCTTWAPESSLSQSKTH